MSHTQDPENPRPRGGATPFEEADAEARLRMESMSRVACALIFQTARDLVCAERALRARATRRPKAVRQHERRLIEIQRWVKTVFPLRYENGGMSLAGAVATINLYNDHVGARRLEYHVVREMLMKEPHRLAIVDGPAEYRTLEGLSAAVVNYQEDAQATTEARATQGELAFA